jgi:uncharacterized membrane protein
MMTLFDSAAPIPSHSVAAMLAVLLGGWQLFSEKGTRRHRIFGWAWVGLMIYVAGSSFFINELHCWRTLSPIHVLSAWTLISLAIAVFQARRGNIRQHRLWMLSLYVLALLLTGIFTLWPGRLLHQVVFGVA